jgi:hypothetical protein
MTAFLYILAFASGVLLGAFIVYKFNPNDVTYQISKLRAKRHGVIDVLQQIEEFPKKEKKKRFNFKNRRKKDGI